jgi:hypothetical protein
MSRRAYNCPACGCPQLADVDDAELEVIRCANCGVAIDALPRHVRGLTVPTLFVRVHRGGLHENRIREHA